MMIYSRLVSIYGHSTTEEILLQAMSLLGRLPHSRFTLRERETCPRVSCPFTVIWFSYLEHPDENGAMDFGADYQDDDLFTVQLLSDQRLSLKEFQSSSLEGIAIEVERHERDMRAKQTKLLVDDQIGIDTGIAGITRRLC